jgi:hypothetical protein
MSMELAPYFQSGSPPTTNAHEALLRVRVTQDPNPNGSITIYLPSGTPLIVRGRDLLRFPGPEPSRSTTTTDIDPASPR